MLIAVILLSAALLAQTVYMRYNQYQVKEIGSQLAFIIEHHSFKLVRLEIRSPELHRLAELCNALLRERQELQRQFAEKKDEVNATVVSLSHDIRTPLTSLGGYLQLAGRAEDAAEQARYIDLAQARMNQVIRYVDELFDYSKLQNPEYMLELEPVDIIDVLHKRLFAVLDDFTRGREPELELPESPVYAAGSAVALERVFDNIIRNYFVHGDGTLSIRFKAERDHIVLHFANRLQAGRSIRPDRLFTRFYKGDPSRTHHSSGLGLSIVSALMERMNGSAQVDVTGGQYVLSLTLTPCHAKERLG